MTLRVETNYEAGERRVAGGGWWRGEIGGSPGGPQGREGREGKGVCGVERGEGDFRRWGAGVS